MAAEKQLTVLQERKRLLLLQTDLHRTVLRAECAGARARLNWLNEARKAARSVSPWLAVGAAAVGLLAARRGRKLASWIPTALAAVRAWRELKSP